MGKFDYRVPVDLMQKFEMLDNDYDTIFGEMVNKSAEYVYGRVVSNMRGSFKTTRSLMQGLRKTRVYKTPSDDGINTYVGFYGYNDEGVPIPLIAMAREYGTSRGEAKKPFLRRAFNKGAIESIMRSIEAKYIKGD